MRNFGKYEIVAKIGEGGFGVVYEAFDPRIARRVAIKTCPTDDETLRQRFLHEARISGSLHHRHIIVVYDYGEEGDVPYLVQEFLTGEDLDRKISRGEDVPFGTKIDYLIQIAQGLDYAHQQGIIHRDIKPSNIRILDDGQVKIMDFGIAKLRDSELALTLPGQTVGTPAYLAPEQIRGLELDARCDIHAFGLLAYELLTHRKAFPSKNASRVLYQILNDEPVKLSEMWPDCPPAFESIIERCYRKDRDRRWSSLAEVADALRGALGGGAPALSGPRRLGAIDHDSETMATPGGTHATAQRAIREAARGGSAASGSPAPSPPGITEHRTDGSQPALDRERSDLDDLVLGGLGASSRPAPASDAPRPRSSGFRVALAVLALAVLATAAWLGLRFLDGESPSEAPPVQETSVGDPATGELPPVGAQSPPPAVEAGVQPESAPAAAAHAPEPTPPSRPTSILVLAASWDPSMTARVGDGEPLLLDQERTVELPAGVPVTVTFTAGRPDFAAIESVELAAERSARTVLETPIGRPGALTVRAGLGAPQLHVTIDGEALGTTPVNLRLLAAGAHEVVVASDDTATPEAQRAYTVDLGSQEEVVLTFDLRRTEPSVARRPYRN